MKMLTEEAYSAIAGGAQARPLSLVCNSNLKIVAAIGNEIDG